MLRHFWGRTRGLLLPALLLPILINSQGFAQESEFKRPAFNPSRDKENYIFLKDPARRTDWFDPIKYIPLNESGNTFLSFGGETRQHFEYIDNNDWGLGPQDSNGYYLQRWLLHGDLRVGDRFRVFTQFMSGIEAGRVGGSRGVDEDRFDLHQAFADFRFLGSQEKKSFTVLAGRQEIIFGSRRFFNYRERPNMRLSHDAAMGILRWNNLDVRIFGARPVGLDPGYFDDESTDGQTVWGVYSVYNLKGIPLNVDLYYLGDHRQRGAFDQGTADELRHTVGTRLWGKTHGLDYNFEFLYQFGKFNSLNIKAYALASDTGYTFRFGEKRSLRLSLRADIYSGDDDRNDGELNSFNPFFPKGKHISQLAATGLINQRDLHPRINFVLDRHWSATISTEFIWRDSLDDGIYSIGNGLLRTGATSRARYVGTQPELEVKYTFNPHVDLKGIFVYFDAGNFIKENPPAGDITYLGSMLTFRF